MSLPVDVVTCNITFGSAVDFKGDALAMSVRVTPTHDLVWTATGQPLVNFVVQADAAAGVPGSIVLPVVDQDGFVNAAGDAFTMWAYSLEVTYTGASGSKRVLKALQPLTGQSVIDLDLISDGSITGPVSAPTATVTSVNGETGSVTFDLDSLGGITPAAVAAAITAATPASSTTVVGLVELATSAETTTGTDVVRAVTPAGVKAVSDAERTTSDNRYAAQPATAAAPVPLAPTSVKALAQPSKAVVSWLAPTLGRPTSYTVTASPGGATATTSGLSATVTGLTNGQAYTFTVTGTNAAGVGAVSAASSSVTPTADSLGIAVDGLVAEWAADQITGSPSNGSTVASVPDSAGNGWTASMSTSSHRPTFVSSWTNGKPALAFDGSLQTLGTLLRAANVGPQCTMFIVCDITATTNGAGEHDMAVISNRINSTTPDQQYSSVLDMQDGTTNRFRMLSQPLPVVSSSTVSTSTPYVVSLTLPGRLYVSGAIVTGDINGLSPAAAGAFYIGSTADVGKRFKGRIARIRIYNRLLSAAERHAVETAMGTFYNVTMASS